MAKWFDREYLFFRDLAAIVCNGGASAFGGVVAWGSRGLDLFAGVRFGVPGGPKGDAEAIPEIDAADGERQIYELLLMEERRNGGVLGLRGVAGEGGEGLGPSESGAFTRGEGVGCSPMLHGLNARFRLVMFAELRTMETRAEIATVELRSAQAYKLQQNSGKRRSGVEIVFEAAERGDAFGCELRVAETGRQGLIECSDVLLLVWSEGRQVTMLGSVHPKVGCVE